MCHRRAGQAKGRTPLVHCSLSVILHLHMQTSYQTLQFNFNWRQGVTYYCPFNFHTADAHAFKFLIVAHLLCAINIQTKNPIFSSPGTPQLNYVYCSEGLLSRVGLLSSGGPPLSCRLRRQPKQMPSQAFRPTHNLLSI